MGSYLSLAFTPPGFTAQSAGMCSGWLWPSLLSGKKHSFSAHGKTKHGRAGLGEHSTRSLYWNKVSSLVSCRRSFLRLSLLCGTRVPPAVGSSCSLQPPYGSPASALDSPRSSSLSNAISIPNMFPGLSRHSQWPEGSMCIGEGVHLRPGHACTGRACAQ